jgi:hypothetical protein
VTAGKPKLLAQKFSRYWKIWCRLFCKWWLEEKKNTYKVNIWHTYLTSTQLNRYKLINSESQEAKRLCYLVKTFDTSKFQQKQCMLWEYSTKSQWPPSHSCHGRWLLIEVYASQESLNPSPAEQWEGGGGKMVLLNIHNKNLKIVLSWGKWWSRLVSKFKAVVSLEVIFIIS